jgi:hypothetical protein
MVSDPKSASRLESVNQPVLMSGAMRVYQE